MFARFLLVLVVLIVVAADRDTEPSQVHIALAGKNDYGDANTMTISWQTISKTTTSTVKYGVSASSLNLKATGSSSSYYETYHHHVTLNVLDPATTYYYQVGDETGGFSEQLKFTSAPNGSTKRSFSYAVFGDLGTYNGNATMNYMTSIKDTVDLVWHSGDVGYADDSFLHQGCVLSFCYEDSYDNYMNLIQPWTSQVTIST